MNIAQSILFGTLTLALHGIVNAQIYESTDAEGVPEFSDTPSAGSEVVDLQQTNIADDPPVIPEAPQAEVARPARQEVRSKARGARVSDRLTRRRAGLAHVDERAGEGEARVFRDEAHEQDDPDERAHRDRGAREEERHDRADEREGDGGGGWGGGEEGCGKLPVR